MRGRLTPYLLVLPAWVWLVVFFVLPTLVMLSLSTQTGDLIDGWRQTLNIAEFSDAIRTYHAELVRSLLYGLEATIACIVLGYPVAWWIATSAGQHKSTYLFLLLLPFFVSFVIRTVSWNFLLRDNGMVLSPLKSIGLLPQNFHVLSTPFAVVAGLTYNFLPFTVLPIYVALEKIDLRLVEAASAGDPPAVAARRLRRRGPDVRSGRLGLRERGNSRRYRHHDDRQHHPDVLFHERRLSDGRGTVVHPHRPAAHRRVLLRQGPRHR
jgi:ABC-type spermidine/putrescine transport system permease subunit I